MKHFHLNSMRGASLTLLFLLLLTVSVLAETRIVILHSNDHHGHLLPSGELGGMARFATLVKRIRSAREAEKASVLLLDAGDLNTGTPESDLFQARPDVLAFNQLHYDFVAFGNHEFDPPFAKLEAQLKLAEFPFGSANVFRGNGQLLGAGWRTFDFPDCRVGVFGLTIANPNIVPKANGNFVIEDEAETARQMVRFLRDEKHADLVIAVAHIGLAPDSGAKIISSQLAEQVPGLDLIVDGHSHTLMQSPVWSHGTPIVSANDWSKYLGEAEFVMEDRKIRSFSWKCHPVTQDLPEDPEMVALLKPFIDAAAERFHQTIAQTAERLEADNKIARRQETALGNLAADSMVWAMRRDGFSCDFAFLNGGNVRASLPDGAVTLADIASAFPFQNEIWVLELDGQTVRELFEFLGALPLGVGGFPQFSQEVRCVFDHRNPVPRLESVLLNGQPIDPTRTYHLAVTDFLAQGGDGFDVLLKRKSFQNSSRIVPAIFAEYLQQSSRPISGKTEGRIRVLKP